MVKQDIDLLDALNHVPKNPDGFEEIEDFFQVAGRCLSICTWL